MLKSDASPLFVEQIYAKTTKVIFTPELLRGRERVERRALTRCGERRACGRIEELGERRERFTL